MLNLMKLEMKRVNTRGMLLTFLLINGGIIGLFLLVCLDAEAAAEFYSSTSHLMLLIEVFVMAAFVIYASVLLSTLIIDEFKNKTITVLYMYSIERRKILMAKLLIVSGITFFSFLISSVLVYYSLYFLNSLIELTPVTLTFVLSLKDMAHLLLTAIATTGISLIPLFFGMMKYSVPATITSSVLLIAVLSSVLNSGVNLFTFIGIPITLGIIGFTIAYLVIKKAVRKDF
ncbi:ABC transporter permease [Sporosarcina sp. Te-1]|uniref:ABC transporter permease n=1 Tax=Sporosarcina sp. Te-1 TaxID=2818390 RepID=UPI001A9FA6B1|nr:ABC transporter permease [Sporosarcina sp. Te-1]QTD39519.1 ABC transporter permease [Sporosarcina sp. Te-1]